MTTHVNLVVRPLAGQIVDGELARVPCVGEHVALQKICYRVADVLQELNGPVWVWLDDPDHYSYVPVRA